MNPGFDSVSLALFTTLAPAGAVAFALLAVFLLAHPRLESAHRARINHLLAIPLFVVWVGFIASATHLGTPANALYVFTQVGKSPLSNEVAAVVAFLFVSGVFWLFSFRRRFPTAVQKAFLAVCVVAACAMVYFMSMAYSVHTVPSWDTWHVPVNFVFRGLLGGGSLASLVLVASGGLFRTWSNAFLALAGVALVVGGVFLGLYHAYLAGVSNYVVQPGQLVGALWWPLLSHAFLSALGLALQWVSFARLDGRRRFAVAMCGCVAVLVAVLLSRLAFYDIYLSAGF